MPIAIALLRYRLSMMALREEAGSYRCEHLLDTLCRAAAVMISECSPSTFRRGTIYIARPCGEDAAGIRSMAYRDIEGLVTLAGGLISW